jgi:hypothetical protein
MSPLECLALAWGSLVGLTDYSQPLALLGMLLISVDCSSCIAVAVADETL